ncbi:MFS transporter [Amycolatopsis sacchari]|uniref:MFS transporter n=1 Tax=Amycolatopsis sacchari TaxID=115433 RepID=UPI003D705DD2
MTTSPTRSAATALLCWLTVLLEGYDLVALGATIPTLLKTHYLGFTAAGATAVATVSLVGVAVGAAGLGPLTDRFGRRSMLIGSVLLFSLFTLLTPFSPNVAVFGVLRFAAGLGLGACMPVALTVMAENLPARPIPLSLGEFPQLRGVWRRRPQSGHTPTEQLPQLKIPLNRNGDCLKWRTA